MNGQDNTSSSGGKSIDAANDPYHDQDHDHPRERSTHDDPFRIHAHDRPQFDNGIIPDGMGISAMVDHINNEDLDDHHDHLHQDSTDGMDIHLDTDIHMDLVDFDQYTNIPPITRPVSIDLGDNDTTDHEHDPNLLATPVGVDVHENDLDHLHLHDHDDHHDDDEHHIPPPPPPRPSEQTTREVLIERERQARLEREKAKLKQQLAMRREWEEEEQKFEEADIARVNSDESIANTSIRGIDLHLDVVVDVDVDVVGVGLDVLDVGVHHEDEDVDAIMQDGVGEMDNGDRGGSSIDCTVGEEDEKNDGGVSNHPQESNEDGGDKPASPLGFTMERFLKDGVVVVSKKRQGGERLPIVAPHIPHIDSDGINSSAVEADDSENRGEITLPLHQETLGDTRTLLNLLDDETHDHGHDHHTQLSPGVSPIDSQRNNMGEPVDDDVDDDDDGVVATPMQLPRLAQLTEAEILEMTELDYASVGNMPPRSLRDEQHLPDGMSNTSFDQTRTTVQGSDMSGGADSSHARSQGGDDTEVLMESPISHVARMPVEAFVSPLPPRETETHEATLLASSNLSVVVNQSDDSIGRSVISDRKPAAVDVSNNNENQHGHGHNGSRSKPKWRSKSEDEPIEDFKWPEHHDLDPGGRKSQSSNELLLETLVASSKDVNSSMESYNFPNRVIRPGMIKVASSEKSSKKGHRRAQTTPNIPSFVDDFDYCKYNDIGRSSGGGGGGGSQFFVSEFDTTQDSHDVSNPGLYLNGNGSGDYFSNYGSTDLESQPLLKMKKSGETRGSMMDEMVDSVFSSVRSMSTADFQAEINDCDKYASSPALTRGEHSTHTLAVLQLSNITTAKMIVSTNLTNLILQLYRIGVYPS